MTADLPEPAMKPAPRRGLGRGLELLMAAPPASDALAQLPVGSIRPNPLQPRRSFEHEALAELADSVRAQGLVQPVLVRPDPSGGYELIAGERRWRAACAAGLATVPAIVREAADRDALLLALAENVAREDLTASEEARGYATLMDELDLTLGEVAKRVGRSKASVSNRVRLLELPDDVIALLDQGALSEGHARAVLAVPGHEDRRRLARRVVREGLSVRAAEAAARSSGARRRPRRAVASDRVLADRACELLGRATGVPARVGPGRLEVPFRDDTQLAEIVEVLERTAAVAAGPLPQNG